jgi:hypothetical protein
MLGALSMWERLISLLLVPVNQIDGAPHICVLAERIDGVALNHVDVCRLDGIG